LSDAGLETKRVELIPKEMLHDRISLEAWVRTTWLPYTQRLPASKRDIFVEQAVNLYLQCHPMDDDGMTHVGMVRLEEEASKP
jgi:trans-aconitate methyltransferase